MLETGLTCCIEQHGKSKWPEYAVWNMMIQRCENPKHIGYKYYGARGVKVCARWRQSFATFISDMGRRPSRRYTIERLNNDKGYTPLNCVWATRKQQGLNSRKIKSLNINVTSQTLIQLEKIGKISRETIRKRLKQGYSLVEALTMKPVREISSVRNSEAFRKMLSEAGRKGGKKGSHEDKVRAGKLGYAVWKQKVTENGHQPAAKNSRADK